MKTPTVKSCATFSRSPTRSPEIQRIAGIRSSHPTSNAAFSRPGPTRSSFSIRKRGVRRSTSLRLTTSVKRIPRRRVRSSESRTTVCHASCTWMWFRKRMIRALRPVSRPTIAPCRPSRTSAFALPRKRTTVESPGTPGRSIHRAGSLSAVRPTRTSWSCRPSMAIRSSSISMVAPPGRSQRRRTPSRFTCAATAKNR